MVLSSSGFSATCLANCAIWSWVSLSSSCGSIWLANDLRLIFYEHFDVRYRLRAINKDGGFGQKEGVKLRLVLLIQPLRQIQFREAFGNLMAAFTGYVFRVGMDFDFLLQITPLSGSGLLRLERLGVETNPPITGSLSLPACPTTHDAEQEIAFTAYNVMQRVTSQAALGL